MKNSDKDMSKMMKNFDEIGIDYCVETSLNMKNDLLIVSNGKTTVCFKFNITDGKYIDFDWSNNTRQFV